MPEKALGQIVPVAKPLFAIVAAPFRIVDRNAAASDMHVTLVDVLDEAVVVNGVVPDDACDVLASALRTPRPKACVHLLDESL